MIIRSYWQEIFLKQLDSAKKNEEALRGGLPSGGGEGLSQSHVPEAKKRTSSVENGDTEVLRMQAIAAYRAKKKGGPGGATMQSLKALVAKSAGAW